MTKLIRVGFFKEMPHGQPTDPSMAAARADSPAPQQDAVARYLEAGHLFIATPKPSVDVFDKRTLISPPHYLTDGRHVWPGDLAHYVRTYNVRLPVSFVEHMMASGFAVPAGVDVSKLQL